MNILKINQTQQQYTPQNFGAKIRLCDKNVLDLNHNPKLLNRHSPMDFFYNVSSTKTNLDLFIRKLKSIIRKYQNNENNSELKNKFLKKSFKAVNNLSTIINKLAILKNIPEVYKSNRILKRTSPEKPNYIDTWARLGNSTKNKTININIEDKRIEEITKQNEPVIFIMNHDNVVRDRFIYPIINSFLNYSYATLGKQQNCPRPYIIVSKNVIKNAGNNTMKKIFDKMGLIPIDANLSDRKTRENINPVRKLIENFTTNKANIFVFPEGNNSIYPDKPLEEKIQLGFLKIIKQISQKKDTVNIVPIGISYNSDKSSMGNIFIGEILKLTKNEKSWNLVSEKTTTDIGEIKKPQTLKNLSDNLAIELKKCITASHNIPE